MLKLRLQRIGKKKHAHYKVVVTEHTNKPKGKPLEFLGSYDPHAKIFAVDKERVAHWLGVGAHASPTVHNLLVTHKIIQATKVVAWKTKKKTKEVQLGEAGADTKTISSQKDEAKKEKDAVEGSAKIDNAVQKD